MNAIAAPIRDRLIGALELARAGATDGEKLAACAAIARILEAHRLRWSDLIVSEDTRQQDETPLGWRPLALECLRRPDDLTPWERKFLQSLIGFKSPSERQLDTLYTVAIKVGLHQRAAT